MIHAQVATLLLATVIAFPCVVFAEPAPDSDTAKLADFLIKGMREQRGRLRRGVFQSKGRLLMESNADRLDGDVELLCAFDFDKGLFRFDREGPRREVLLKRGQHDNPAENVEESKPTVARRRFVYYRVPSHSVHYQASSGSVNIFDPSQPPGRLLEAFDIRAVGLSFKETYSDGTPFDQVLEIFLKFPLSEVVDEGKGVYRLRWLLASGQHRRTLWIDASKGFTPIRFEAQDRRVPSNSEEPDGWPTAYLMNRAEWNDRDGVYVPLRFQIEQRIPNSSLLWSYDHTFTWQSVNRDIPTDLFTVDGLGCPKGTVVWKRQGDHNIIERRVGVEEQPLEKKTVELFKQRGEYVERMAFAKIEAQRGLLRILIVLGDPQSEATRKFVELREKDTTLGPGFGHFITMPIGADDSEMLRGLADEFGPDVSKLANPALVVLDEQGKLVATKASVIKAEAIATEADELLKFLTDHAPSYPDADKLLTEALERARCEGKRVFLQETATWCGPCRLLSEFINKHKTIFDDNYVYLKIDGRFQHAEQVMRRFRDDFSGVPWIAVLDAQATLLGKTVGPEGNYGFPSDPKSIDQFVQLIEKTAPRLGTDQLTELRQDLEAKSETEVVK